MTLDDISGPFIVRKSSMEQTEECPVWDSSDQCYKESDAQLRQRIKDIMGGEATKNADKGIL